MKKRNFDDKPENIIKQEQGRRTELAMLYLLMEKYPHQAREKIRKPTSQLTPKIKTTSL